MWVRETAWNWQEIWGARSARPQLFWHFAPRVVYENVRKPAEFLGDLRDFDVGSDRGGDQHFTLVDDLHREDEKSFTTAHNPSICNHPARGHRPQIVNCEVGRGHP